MNMQAEANMAAEKSHTSLGIPADLAAVLSSIDSEKHELPVWTFTKHESGYSLKLFWKFKHDEAPFKAHSSYSWRKFPILAKEKLSKQMEKELSSAEVVECYYT